MIADDDARVRRPALEALAVTGAPDLNERLAVALEAPRLCFACGRAARLIGEKKPEGGAARLAAAYARSVSDATYRRASRRARGAGEV